MNYADELLKYKPKDNNGLRIAMAEELAIVVHSREVSNDVKMEKVNALLKGYEYLRYKSFWKKKKR